MNKIKHILFVILRWLIKKLVYVNTNLYRKTYHWYLRKVGVTLKGTPHYIAPNVYFDSSKNYSLIEIGDKVTLSGNVTLLTHDQSPLVPYRALGEKFYGFKYDKISIDNNSFIGMGATILQGTHIGRNSIVGAGAVVKGNFPDNSIITGNPAKVVGDVFEWHERKSKNKEELSKINKII